jgi:uncharacterized repeat protein (TIGR01451 family)
VNDDIVYVITVTNTGGAAMGVVITDALATHAVFEGASHGGTYSEPLARWNVDHLGGSGTQITRVLTVTTDRTIVNEHYGVSIPQLFTVSGTPPVTTTIDTDLSITKSGPQTATAGVGFTYIITVTNNGGSTDNAAITDTIPAGSTFVSASGAGLVTDGQVLWKHVELPAYTSSVFTFTVIATRTVVNSDYGVRHSPGSTDVITGTDVVTTIIAPILSITKSGPPTATVGAEITYTLVVTNTGGLASGVVITDRLPTDANFVRATGSISPSGGVLSWDIGQLAYGESVIRTFVVTASQTITNEHYGARSDNGSTVTGTPEVVTTIAPDLSITKSGPSMAAVGMEITYTLTVTNNGGLASGVVVTDAVPLNATFVSASDGGSLITATNVVTWNLGGLNTYDMQELTFTVIASQTITNDDYWAIPEGGDPVRGTDAVTTVIAPDLVITKSGPPTATAGTEFVYTITVTNTDGLATGVVITDTLPAGAHYSGASHSGTPTGNGVVVWNPLPDIPVNSSLFVTLTVTATQSVTNTDYVVDANHTPPVAGSVVVSTTIAPLLTITKSGPPTATAGTDFVYTLTVTNTGGLAAGVVITDWLPTGAYYRMASHSGGDTGNAVVVWNSPFDIPFNESLSVTLTVTATQSVTNADYIVTADGALPASGDLVSTTIAPALVITKSAPYSVTTSEEITFTLRVTNTGGLARNLVITDVLPTAANFVRASEGIAPFGGVLTWTVTQPLSYTRHITRTFTVTATQTITNEHYGVRAAGGYVAPIPLPVVVRIE